MDDLLRQWDKLAGAIMNVETALPHQMTPAINKLVEARMNMASAMTDYAMVVYKDESR